MQLPLLAKLRWMRVFGDVIFSLGAVALAWFVAGLKIGWSLEPETSQTSDTIKRK